MNSPNATMPEAPKIVRRICPFLGIKEDPDTSLAFPADVNYCYAAEPAGVPKIDYQANHCLALTYLSCPVYSSQEKGPLPAEIRLKSNGGGLQIKWQASWLVRTIGAFIIGTLIFFIGWFGVAGLNRSITEREALKTQPALPILATSTPFHRTATSTPTPSVTPLTPTETPTPPLATPLNPQAPQTNCGRPAGWVAYIIRPGDTLSRLSLAFGITIAQLQNANCMGASTVLRTGTALYVPYTPANPIYPTLEPTLYNPTYMPTDTLSGGWTPVPPNTPIPEIPTFTPISTPGPSAT